MLHLLLAGLCLFILIKSANAFIDQSLAVAKKLKLSGFLIGFTILSLGTALPDIIISIFAVTQNNPDFAISTFLGSAFANMTLLVGVLSFFTKYKLNKTDVEKNIPITFAASVGLLILILLFRMKFTWIVGIIVLAIYIITILFASQNNNSKISQKTDKINIAIFIISFILLIVAGKICTDQFILFANQYNISNSLVGYFMVALGITIPELVTSLEVIKRGDMDLSLGNILGATLINILFIPGLASLLTTLNFRPFIPGVIFLIISILIFYFLSILGKEYYITKREGFAMLLIYILFILFQFI